MGKIYTSLIQLIGNTPLLELSKIEKNEQLECRLIAKVEFFNPGGSVKDRVALSMIEDAERKGLLTKNSLIVEATSGNMGIGLAWVALQKGYKVTLTMPETMSKERQMLLKAFGAEIVLTTGDKGMLGAIQKAEEMKRENENVVILQQFENISNPMAHELTTAEEIWNDTNGNIDVFVAGVGTGGTISGTGKGLKHYNPNIEIVAVEPFTSAVLSGDNAGQHKIQGIGAGFVPKNYDNKIVDKVIAVSDDSALECARMLAKEEGLLVGVSSGAALSAALQLAKTSDYKGKTIAVLLPDTGERYLSTGLFG